MERTFPSSINPSTEQLKFQIKYKKKIQNKISYGFNLKKS